MENSPRDYHDDELEEYHAYFDINHPSFKKAGRCLRMALINEIIYIVDFSTYFSLYKIRLANEWESFRCEKADEVALGVSKFLLFRTDSLKGDNNQAFSQFLTKNVYKNETKHNS